MKQTTEDETKAKHSLLDYRVQQTAKKKTTVPQNNYPWINGRYYMLKEYKE